MAGSSSATSAAAPGSQARPATASAATSLAWAVIGAALCLYAGAAASFEITRAMGGDLGLLSALNFALAALGALAALALSRRGPRPGRAQPSLAGALALVMLAGAALAIIAFRPDFDDSYYMGNVTYALAHPGAAITDEIRSLAAAPLAPFRSAHWATAVGYDYLGASLAQASGANILDLRYFWLPGLAGMVLVAGSFVLLRRMGCPDRDALIATLAVVVLYVIWREAHRDPGNFAFPRFFQGKAVLLTALLPVFSALVLTMLRQPSALAGAGLAALALAAGGMSASAVFILGALGIGVVTGALVAWPREAGLLLRRSVLAGLCCAPLVLPLLHALGDPLPLGPDSPANEGWPMTVAAHAVKMGKSTWALLAVSLGVVAVFTRGPARALVLGWSAAVLVAFLNPLTGQWLIDHAVGPNAYWRLFYVLPWVPLAGLSVLALFERLPGVFARHRGLWLAGALAAAVPGMAVLDHLRGQAAPGWPPEWKLPRAARAEAAAVLEASPPGAMLAPLEIARMAPVLDGTRPQLRIQEVGIRVWALHAGQPDLADRRILATTALSGAPTPKDESRNAAYLGAADLETQLAALAQVLAESRPASVVMAKDLAAEAEIATRLEAAGYTRHGETSRHLIWSLAG